MRGENPLLQLCHYELYIILRARKTDSSRALIMRRTRPLRPEAGRKVLQKGGTGLCERAVHAVRLSDDGTPCCLPVYASVC